MGRILTMMYLTIALFCFGNVFVTIHTHQYQHTLLSVFLALFNLALFAIFRKKTKRPHLRLIHSIKQ